MLKLACSPIESLAWLKSSYGEPHFWFQSISLRRILQSFCIWVMSKLVSSLLTFCATLLVHRLSPGYPRTTGASYSTTVPHSQSHAAWSSPHMASPSQPLLTHRPIYHGVPPWGEVGGSGWPDLVHWDWAHSTRPRSGQWHTQSIQKLDCMKVKHKTSWENNWYKN